jgi:ribosomal protein S18 acetylase RimI-like enzyme
MKVELRVVAAPIHEGHIQLEKLYVLPRFQNRGVGSRLLRDLQQSANLQNTPIHLRVLSVNNGARRLYERLGFVVRHAAAERVFMQYHA